MNFRKNLWMLSWAVLAVIVVVAAGCGSDSSTGPGGGGNLASYLPAGSYTVNFNAGACPPNLTAGPGITFDLVSCGNTSWQDLFDLTDCPFNQEGDDSLWIDCTFTQGDALCSTTYHVTGSGKKVGNVWTINGRTEIIAESPAGCSGDPTCEVATVIVTQTSAGAPSACQYGDPGSVDARVSGGPLNGQTLDLLAAGFPTSTGTNEWQWGINAYYNSTGAPPNLTFNIAGLNASIPPTLTTGLPASYPVDVSLGFKTGAEAAGIATVFADYSEQYLNGGYFFAESVSNGSWTVNEISGTHIAGSYTITFAGQQLMPPSQTLTPTTRMIQGRYYVLETQIVAADQTTEIHLEWPGYIEAARIARANQ